MFKAKVVDSFSAAHRLREYQGDCERLHGHNYRIEVVVSSPSLDEQGIVMDFRELKKLLKGVLHELDHQYLNDLAPFNERNPSAENIAKHLFETLSPLIKEPVRLFEVTVWENDASCVSYAP
ncbi:MAG TPA: 6-carboxytetrahydropterin synthase QueD [Deltaproteobacteria bacterium]|nr:6-carboxytetrahydropterin synthase QueD [Deltaproteobacteria bacterium]HQJ08438.1 6-carboxytetrahydropterin synthase QueD [Deltaproteobacteria bacterium]